MKYKTLETCTLRGTRLSGQTACLRTGGAYDAAGSDARIPFRVVITRGSRRQVATSASDLATRLAEVTPTLREFAESKPGSVCFLLAFLEDRHRPIRDNDLWKDWAAETKRRLEDYLPELEGDVLVWRHLELGERGTKIPTNRFNVVTGRFEKVKSAVA